ncbi:MAG: hypothetical protein JKY37_31480 [Nannocystaceae bacterium]|nr:hypothetical protein [Nannocystaceae bacterium]
MPNLHRRVVCSVLAASLLAPGCATTEDEDEDIPFGLGGKADSLCAPEAELCWDQDDAATMRELLRAQDDVVLGVASKAAARHVIDLARGIKHKLTAEELAALDTIEPEVDGLAEDDIEGAVEALTVMQAQSLRRVIGTYYVANMIPVGQLLDSGGKFDDGSSVNPGATDSETVVGLTEGMEESLRLLRDSGAMGIAIAEMYKMTGVLDRDYELVNAINFGEFDAVTGNIVPRGISREAKVEHVVGKYRKAAGWVGAGAGVVGLIPIAGIPLSISGETIALFKLHAQMSFEIASIYGWDLREGNNLFLMSMMFMTDGLIAEVGDVLASNVLVPIIAKRVAGKLGIELTTNMAAKIAGRSITDLLAFFSKRAQRQLAEAAIEAGVKGVGKQLLGWATLGLTVLVSAGLDYIATDALGRHVATVSKKWLHDLLLEGTSYLAKPAPRDCAMRALAAVAWDDGVVSEREQVLFMAFLAKPYNADEQSWFHLDSTEKVRQSKMLAEWKDNDSKDDVKDCLQDEFEGSLDQHRMSLLAHVFSMVQIDQEQTGSEKAFYDDIRSGLDGSGWFDGEEIDEIKMDYIERAVFVTLNPNTIEVADDLREVTEALLVEDVLPFMLEPHAETQADFNCGFAGDC